MNEVVSVQDLTFSYGSTEVLSDVSFRLEQASYVALTGPNGAGKTTLIKVLLGLVNGYQGAVKLFGQDRKAFAQWGRVGYLPQRVNVFNPLFPATVREVVGLGLLSQKRFPKTFKKEDRATIMATLDLMGITALKDKLVGDLSGGQQQRVFLARALVSQPELLILDEPSTALDPQSREGFFDLLQELNQNRNLTIILITHDTAQIGQYAHELLYLDKTVIFHGNFADFCASEEMGLYFGRYAQHVICHQHP